MKTNLIRFSSGEKGANAPEKIGKSGVKALAAKGLLPSQYVVYYDERHTTGTDILQLPEALNLLTFDEKMLTRTKTQSAMRLRQFLNEQSIDIVTGQLNSPYALKRRQNVSRSSYP